MNMLVADKIQKVIYQMKIKNFIPFKIKHFQEGFVI